MTCTTIHDSDSYKTFCDEPPPVGAQLEALKGEQSIKTNLVINVIALMGLLSTWSRDHQLV